MPSSTIPFYCLFLFLFIYSLPESSPFTNLLLNSTFFTFSVLCISTLIRLLSFSFSFFPPLLFILHLFLASLYCTYTLASSDIFSLFPLFSFFSFPIISLTFVSCPCPYFYALRLFLIFLPFYLYSFHIHPTLHHILPLFLNFCYLTSSFSCYNPAEPPLFPLRLSFSFLFIFFLISGFQPLWPPPLPYLSSHFFNSFHLLLFYPFSLHIPLPFSNPYPLHPFAISATNSFPFFTYFIYTPMLSRSAFSIFFHSYMTTFLSLVLFPNS